MHFNLLIFCLEQEQFIDAVVITTTGVAAEYQGDIFGIYLKEDGTKNEAPYYRQASFNQKGIEEIYLYRLPEKTWTDTTSSRGGYFQNSQKSSTVPERGWKYYKDNGIYAEDRNMEVKDVKNLKSDEMCVTVMVNGDDEHEFHEYFGKYTIYVLDGDKAFSNGRYVYHNNKNKFIQARKGKTCWSFCDDLECSSYAFWSAGGANNLNPASSEAAENKDRFPGRKGWGFIENDEWVKIELNVTCVN